MLVVSSLIQHLPYLGLVTLFILGALGFPFPEDGILVLSGFLAVRHVVEPIPAFLVVYCSVLLTDFFLFSIGRKYGRRLIEHKRFRGILAPDSLSKLEDRFNRRGSWVVFLGRLSLGLRAQIFLVAGLLRMSRARFLIADGTSALLTVTFGGGAGYAGGNGIETMRENISRVGHIFMLILLLALGGWIAFKYFKEKRSREDHLLPPEPLEGDPLAIDFSNSDYCRLFDTGMIGSFLKDIRGMRKGKKMEEESP
jgi:membrane protein DedA with SNARE-associated domain